jgi:hypothetical protein
VRRRLEPTAPMHAAGREQRDALVPGEPCRGLGGVTCVGVPGRRTTSPRPSSSCKAARTSGRTGSETRARVGIAAASSCRRSSARRRSTSVWSTGWSMTIGRTARSAGVSW